ncbi:MAG: XrtA/PEP-CTERM system-associated ATPase [Gammaproteobacteria bacterium]
MYDTFFKFKDKPFRLSPDPRLFFNSHSHKRALSYLMYGVSQGEGFIVVTGDVGTGKTTLAMALCGMLRAKDVVVGKVVTTQIEAEDLVRVVAAEFGLPVEGRPKGVLLKALESFFRHTAQEGKRVLLIVDEAQNLPPRSIEELRMLSNFEFRGRPLVQSFLLGQKEFRSIMRAPQFVQLRQRVIAAYHLRPLGAAETKEYIEHRLRVVGWQKDPVIEDAVYAAVHRYTQGIPRRINVLCERLLLYAALEGKHTIDSKVLDTVSNDLRKEDLSGVTDERQGVTYVNPGAARVPGPGAREEGTVPGGNERIDALQSSLESLGHLVKRELIMLRKAVLGPQSVPDKDDPDPLVLGSGSPVVKTKGR